MKTTLSLNESRTVFAVLLTLLAFTMAACTQNQRAREFGGEMIVKVPCDQVVFDVTWKGEDLWYATQPARADWRPERKTFAEASSFGLIEGQVTLVESRCTM
jgi:hypothetical protein